MASVAMMVAGAVVNALAFTGGNALFSMMNNKDAAEEAKRHNAALEEYNKQMQDFNRKRAENQDWLSTQLTRKRDADSELYNVDKAFDVYAKLPHKDLTAPRINYEPSEEQKKYERLFVAGGAGLGVALASRFIQIDPFFLTCAIPLTFGRKFICDQTH
jgi:predicted lipase